MCQPLTIGRPGCVLNGIWCLTDGGCDVISMLPRCGGGIEACWNIEPWPNRGLPFLFGSTFAMLLWKLEEKELGSVTRPLALSFNTSAGPSTVRSTLLGDWPTTADDDSSPATDHHILRVPAADQTTLKHTIVKWHFSWEIKWWWGWPTSNK